MEFSVTATDGLARRGRLVLAHGAVETPIFMPGVKTKLYDVPSRETPTG